MEDDTVTLHKRNTDCVYFLASPLTCKKGMDCEYRHNEIARLNPRDCWYWLAGNCLNPTCAFRHPPLEIHAEAPPEPSSVTANKTNVPCYFYFNGFCNKGDSCCFMHGPDANPPTGKSGNAALAIKEDIPLDNKIIVRNDSQSAPLEAHASQSETAANTVMDLKMKPKGDFQFAAPERVVVRSTSPLIGVSPCEEVTTVKPGFLLQADSFTESGSQEFTDQNSEEEMDDHVEPEEWWESSPDLDVLVNDESETLVYEDDQEYLQALDREQRDPNNHFLGSDFQNLVEHEPTCYDAEDNHESKNYYYTDFVDNVHIFDDITNGFGPSVNPMSDSLFSRKRKLVAMQLSVSGQRAVDLRDRLGKRRVIDGHSIICSSRRRDSFRLLGRSQGRPRRHGNNQQPLGRLASEVRKNIIEPHQKNGSLLNGDNCRGWLRHSRSNRSKQRLKEKRLAKKHILSAEVPKKQVPWERKYSQESMQFTGPKTLAQIKEEKKKAEENGDCTTNSGNSRRMAVADFESPKPLSEILKDKRRSAQDFDGRLDD